jgi:hypothetical protein
MDIIAALITIGSKSTPHNDKIPKTPVKISYFGERQ